MLDIKFIRENPEIVKENIRKKFQNAKLPLVDEVIALDAERRAAINEGETLKAERNKLSKANGPLFGKLKKCADEAEKAAIQAEIDANNAAVKANAERMAHLEEKKANAEAAMNKLLLVELLSKCQFWVAMVLQLRKPRLVAIVKSLLKVRLIHSLRQKMQMVQSK